MFIDFIFFGLAKTAIGAILLAVAMTQPTYAKSDIRIPSDPCSWMRPTWNGLNAAEQETWSKLGWNRRSWDSKDEGDNPLTFHQLWVDLSATKRDLARDLGYSEETWDLEECPSASATAEKISNDGTWD